MAAQRSEVLWTRVFLFCASCIAGLIVARRRKLHRFHLHILNEKSADCGRLFALDIGGTLAKMVYFQPVDGVSATQQRQMELQLNRSKPLKISEKRRLEGSLPLIDDFIMSLHSTDEAQRDARLQMFVPDLGGTIHFIKSVFEQFSSLFESRLGIELEKEDEMDALIKGLNFVLWHAPNECYTFVNVVPATHGLGSATKTILPKPDKHDLYPFLLVNIGSGVSILKITGESNYERVSGTSLGGGTFLGLCRALSKLRTFDEAMDASVDGDSNSVDMTVGDIYGSNGYKQFQLSPDTLASSFGKVGARNLPHSPRDADIACSLLFMITQNLGQLAFLNARRVNTQRIYFSGNFLRHNELACRQLAFAISFWSKGDMQAQFFHHEGFFGALGAFLLRYNSLSESPATSGTEVEPQRRVDPNKKERVTSNSRASIATETECGTS